MGFAHKTALIGVVVLVGSSAIIAMCGEAVHAVAICNMGATIIGAVASHMVELYFRRNYAERVQEKRRLSEDKRRLEARQHGRTAPLGSAPACPLCLLRARLVALGSSQSEDQPLARIRASRLQSRRFHCV